MQQHKAKILVIDDDECVVNALYQRLERAGYQCVTVSHPAEAIESGVLDVVDLIICDLLMPDVHGLDVIREVRQRRQVPIIVVTGYAERFRPRLVWIPNVTVLGKPFHAEALMSLVEAALTLPATPVAAGPGGASSPGDRHRAQRPIDV